MFNIDFLLDLSLKRYSELLFFDRSFMSPVDQGQDPITLWPIRYEVDDSVKELR